MCLGIPAKIVEVYPNNGLLMARVDFGGVLREVCVETLPEAKPGDYTIVHAGFALNLLSKEEALETLQLLHEAGVIEVELNPEAGLSSKAQEDR
jgi:hydrogenase expression/formation protein HypC